MSTPIAAWSSLARGSAASRLSAPRIVHIGSTGVDIALAFPVGGCVRAGCYFNGESFVQGILSAHRTPCKFFVRRIMLALLAASQAFTARWSSNLAAATSRTRALACVAELPQLEADAQALLDEAGGDALKARASYIGYTMAYLEDAEPELFAALKSDPTREDCHAAIVEITWDAIAAFLPVTHSPVPTPAAQKKLAAIARAGCDGVDLSPATLDVGCGNGLLLPFLAACGAPPDKYRGIDLSGRMIQVAQGALERKVAADSTYAGASFDELSFKDLVAEGGTRYDAIYFNAALQFLKLDDTLAAAAKLLAPGPASRLVLSHLNGAAFVRKEREESASTVISTMPSLAELEAAAEPLGLQVAIPSFFGTEPEEIEAAMEDFYLVILRWDAAHGGIDGQTGLPTTTPA